MSNQSSSHIRGHNSDTVGCYGFVTSRPGGTKNPPGGAHWVVSWLLTLLLAGFSSNVLAQTNCGFVTYTQGGYGSPAHGSNPGTLVQTRFASAFPSGLVIGCTGAGGHTLTLTTAAAVTAFLPSGSNPGALTQNYINPGHSYSSEFAGQLASLTLSVHFSSTNLGGAVITTGTFAGLTVNQLLVIANNVYGGCSTQYTLSQLNTILTAINEAYDEGHVSTLLSCCTVALGTPSITNVGCTGGSTGSFTIAATGGSGYMYALATVTGGTVGTYGTAQASGTFSNLAAGTYSVKVTAAGGCSDTKLVRIESVQSHLSLTLSDVGAATCASNGTATLTASGGSGNYTYRLTNTATNAVFSNSNGAFTTLTPGFYQVLVTDATTRCTVTCAAIEIRGVNTITGLTATGLTNVTCFGANNGRVTLTVAGGAAPFTFRVDGQTIISNDRTVTFNNLAPALNIPISVTSGSCTFNGAAVNISQPVAPLGVTLSTLVQATCTSATGSAT
ncbi:SprB repeat-containing protein, partial [Hymenobacter sp. BT770]|uniref:SprB repeat-containing protein n=1 Tax=Hymenobacter sp. BT770 TaxID=2886942 RepID=UPI001D111324